jgi:hypothetical protein
VSSNIALSSWGRYLGDATLTAAILDRLAMHALRIDIEAPLPPAHRPRARRRPWRQARRARLPHALRRRRRLTCPPTAGYLDRIAPGEASYNVPISRRAPGETQQLRQLPLLGRQT